MTFLKVLAVIIVPVALGLLASFLIDRLRGISSGRELGSQNIIHGENKTED